MKKTGFYVTPLEQEIFIKGNWTIENKTSFQRLKDEDTATMYLGGFANKHQIEFLKKVISDNPFVKYYHFGDIDIGGFLIHKHLCRETAKKFDLYCMGIQQLHDMRFRYCLRETLSTLNFIRKGMNLCIFGASDSGKTYLARALGTEACREFRVGYYHCEDLASELAAVRKTDHKQYQKMLNSIINLDLVILDDFLLHPITEDDEVKALYDIMERDWHAPG